jgi:hypothetical protein
MTSDVEHVRDNIYATLVTVAVILAAVCLVFIAMAVLK